MSLASGVSSLAAAVAAEVKKKAPLTSPAFTGTPTAPTAAGTTNSTQIASTAFVKAAIAANPGPTGPTGPTGPAGSSVTTGQPAPGSAGVRVTTIPTSATTGWLNNASYPYGTLSTDANGLVLTNTAAGQFARYYQDTTRVPTPRLMGPESLQFDIMIEDTAAARGGAVGMTLTNGGERDTFIMRVDVDPSGSLGVRFERDQSSALQAVMPVAGIALGQWFTIRFVKYHSAGLGYVNGNLILAVDNGPDFDYNAATVVMYGGSTTGMIAHFRNITVSTVSDLAGSAAPLASPAFTGNPTAPTPATADSSITLATTAFVKAQGYATLASPTFTGTPTLPTGTIATTQTSTDSSTKVATTAFVATTFAKKASPAFTGNPTAPTPLAGDASTSLATTAFVSASFAPKASPTIDSPTFTGIPQITNGPPALDQTAYVPNAAWVRTNAVPRYQGISASGTVTYQRIAQVFNGGGSTGSGHVALLVSGAGSSTTSTRSTGLLEVVVFNTTITPRMTWLGAAPNAGSFVYVPNGTGIWDIYWVTSSTANAPTFSVLDEQNVTLISGEAGSTVAPTGNVAIAATTLTTVSPTFTGTVTVPTPTAGDNTTKAASTAFVATALGSYLTTTTAASTYATQTSDNAKAPLASPALTGTPTAPTAAAGTNTTQIATTAFVAAAVSGGGSGYAPLASPQFTGIPTAPTASPGTNTTQIATTAYSDAETGAASPENFASTFTAAAPTSQQSAGIASESQAGITQIATAAETNAGVVTSKSVSPKNLVARGTGIIFVADLTALLALTSVPDFQWAFVSSTHALVYYNLPSNKWFLADTSGHLAFPSISERDNFTSNIQALFAGLRCTVTTDSTLGTTGSVYRWTGSAWQAWETPFMNYSPTVTGVSGTAGGSPGWIVNFARYRYVAGHVEGEWMITLNGSTAALTAALVVTTPTLMSTSYASFVGVPVLKGVVQITDNSPAATYDGLPNRTGSTNQQMKVVILGTNGTVSNLSPTFPITWAQNDSLVCHYSYEVD